MKAAPLLRLEIGYGATWRTEPEDIDWTDETCRINDRRSLVDIVRGASSARGKVDAGELSLVLNNQDRRFDPTYADGPLYGQLVPGVPVRVVAAVVDPVTDEGSVVYDHYEPVWDSLTEVTVWSGTIPSWPQRYDRGDTWATVPLRAYDRFDKLSRAKIPRSVMESAIMPLNPVGYWPLDDPQGSRYVGDVTGRNQGTVWDEPELGSTPIAPGLGPSARFDGENDRIDISRSFLIPDPLSESAVVAVIRTTQPGDVGVIRPVFFQSDGNGPGNESVFSFYVDPEGRIARVVTRSGAGIARRSDGPVTDGRPHLVMGVSGPGAENGVCVDSAVIEPETFVSIRVIAAGVAIGGTPFAPPGWDDHYYAGQISEVAVWDRHLTFTEREAIVMAYNALDGQRTDERIEWILDEIGWPAGFRDLSTGRTTLGPATFKPGDSALEYLRLIEDTEDGTLFVDPEGRLAFHDRFWRYLETPAVVSQFTFTDEPGDPQYADFQLDVDDELLVNVARYSRRDGGVQVAVNQTSVDLYGEAEDQKSNLLLKTDTQARFLAEWAVATKSVPLPRVPHIRVPLHTYSPEDQVKVLSLDLEHRVSVKRTPQGIGDPIELDFLVRGIRHEVGHAQWWTTLYVEPVPTDAVNLFRLDISELDGPDILAF